MKRFECSAILFDLDGVLVDSAGYVERQWRRWARARGLRPEPFLRVCHGRRALETIRLAAPDLDAEAEVRALATSDDAEAASIAPLDGADRVLRTLPPGSWAVVTSGPRPTATSRLRRAGLTMPEVLVCAEDVSRGKPSPDGYLLAAERLGRTPSACLVVEDAPAGIQAARAAGMQVLGLATTHQPSELAADACARGLTAVYVGRIDRDWKGTLALEVLVVND